MKNSDLHFRVEFQGKQGPAVIWDNVFVVKQEQSLYVFLYLSCSFDQKSVSIFVESHLYFCNTFRRNATQSQHFCNNVKEGRWKNSFSLNKTRRKPSIGTQLF